MNLNTYFMIKQAERKKDHWGWQSGMDFWDPYVRMSARANASPDAEAIYNFTKGGVTSASGLLGAGAGYGLSKGVSRLLGLKRRGTGDLALRTAGTIGGGILAGYYGNKLGANLAEHAAYPILYDSVTN